MKKKIGKRKILCALILLGVICCIIGLTGRARVEADGKTYDIIMDYSDLKAMVKQSNHDMDYWLDFFKEQGVEKVGLLELTLQDVAAMQGSDLSVETAGYITQEYQWQKQYPAQLAELIEASENSQDTLISCDDPETFQWILSAYEKRAEGIQYEVVEDESGSYLWIYGDKNGITGWGWTSLPLGLWPETVEQLQEHGFTIIPRTRPIENANGTKFAQAIYEDFQKYNSPYFVTAGELLIGYDDEQEGQKALLEYLEESEATICVTETPAQQQVLDTDGLEQLLEATNYNAVRMFSMWNYVQNSYAKYSYEGPEEIVNCLFRSVYERSCRVVYFKMILQAESITDYVTDEKDYVQLLSGLQESLGAKGCTYVGAEALEATEPYAPSQILLLLVGVGIGAAWLLLLELFIKVPDWLTWCLFVLGVLGIAALLYIAPSTMNLILSIAGGAVMPSLAAVGMNRWIQNWKKKPIKTSGTLAYAFSAMFVMTLVAFCGSLMASLPLSNIIYMLEIHMYRGVKLMQLLPLVIFVISWVQVFLWEGYFCPGVRKAETLAEQRAVRKKTWNQMMETPVKFRHVFIALVALMILGVMGMCGWYYLARTGNTTSVPISNTELMIRNVLEQKLAARPRTKEFLFGYPCLVLMIWSVCRDIKPLAFLFGCGGVIGVLVSIVNTFLHIRTGVVISVYRTMIGFAFGLVTSLIAFFILEMIYRLIRKNRR